jgi:hypothetical protein
MHLIPKYDFNISFLDEADNEEYPEDLVIDIFDVIINSKLGIYIKFIPEINGIDEKWPFDFYYDHSTVQDLRKLFLLESKYVVTPSNKWKGETKILSKEFVAKCFQIEDIENMRDVIIFFISTEEFELYKNEKEKISVYNLDGDDKLSRGSVENLEKDYKLPKFLKNRIINSPYLSDQDLSFLKRKRDENGNIIPMED